MLGLHGRAEGRKGPMGTNAKMTINLVSLKLYYFPEILIVIVFVKLYFYTHNGQYM